MTPTQLQVPQPQLLLSVTYSFSRCLTICSGMRRFWQMVSASHTTASQMLPSWNRRNSDFSPQKVRKSRACRGEHWPSQARDTGHSWDQQNHSCDCQPTICNHSMALALLHPTQHKQGSPHLRVISLWSLLQHTGSKLGDKQEPKHQGPDILVFWGLSINRPL